MPVQYLMEDIFHQLFQALPGKSHQMAHMRGPHMRGQERSRTFFREKSLCLLI